MKYSYHHISQPGYNIISWSTSQVDNIMKQKIKANKGRQDKILFIKYENHGIKKWKLRYITMFLYTSSLKGGMMFSQLNELCGEYAVSVFGCHLNSNEYKQCFYQVSKPSLSSCWTWFHWTADWSSFQCIPGWRVLICPQSNHVQPSWTKVWCRKWQSWLY